MRSFTWFAAGALAAAATTGCGDKYRPVITPVTTTAPASESTSYAVVISQPGYTGASSTTDPCPATSYAQNAVATVVDFSGDSVMAQAEIGNGPLTSAIDPTGTDDYVLNCDGTITTVPISAILQSSLLDTTTLFAKTSTGQASIQSNILVRSSAAPYVVNQVRGTIAATTTTTAGLLSLLQEVAVAPAVVQIAGLTGGETSTGGTVQRIYAISQGATGSSVKWGDCSTPANVTSNGEADGVEVSTNSVSSRLALGVCPTAGITSLDGLRTYVLNRGNATSQGSVSVINTQTNTLDTNLNATGTIALPVASGATNSGPVYAAFYPQNQILAVVNYDSNTVSFINTPLDVYGNDATGFGQVLATVPVGSGPTAISILGDGSRAYVVNQNDGTVSVINMTSYTVEKTITVTGHPRAIASTYNYPNGKVYVVAPDSEVLNIINTTDDTITAQITLQGYGVDVHTTLNYSAATGTTADTSANTIVTSDSSGSGIP